MSRYDNAECPVCNEKFTQTDDVVVCPVCGAPHHRSCYQNNGKCHFDAEHASGKQWEDRRREKEQAEHRDDPRKCAKCGAVNPQDGIFCQVCGYTLRDPAPEENTHSRTYTAYGIPPIDINPFTTPFGGVAPEEDIDGVTAKELALFVGENSFYYIPRMKTIKKQKRNVSWNWSACIFSFMYYFNRKMYLMGAIMLALYILSIVPTFVFAYHLILRNPDAVTQGMMFADVLDYSGLDSIMFISNIAYYAYMTVTVLSGIFANKLYTDFVYRRIGEVRGDLGSVDRNAPEYCNALAAAGRTNHILAVGSAAAVSALYMVAMLVVAYLASQYIL